MKRILLSLALITSAVSSGTASAAVIIDETFNAGIGQGEFTVTNNSGEGLFAFFVGNNTATGADKSDPALAAWHPSLVSRTQWENGTIAFPNAGRVGLLVGGNSWTPPDTTTISWDATFGAGTNQALGYWVDGFGEVPQTPLADGTTQAGFIFYSALPNSPFIAFGTNGVIGQGNTNVVPVPAAVWLFGSGLIALVGVARRRKA